jgi:hypothetical protein
VTTSKTDPDTPDDDCGTDKPSSVSSEYTGASCNGTGAVAHNPPSRPWKKVALCVGGGVVLIGATVVVTLAITHDSAVRENLVAYLNGKSDGFDDAVALLESVGLFDDVNDFF